MGESWALAEGNIPPISVVGVGQWHLPIHHPTSIYSSQRLFTHSRWDLFKLVCLIRATGIGPHPSESRPELKSFAKTENTLFIYSRCLVLDGVWMDLCSFFYHYFPH